MLNGFMYHPPPINSLRPRAIYDCNSCCYLLHRVIVVLAQPAPLFSLPGRVFAVFLDAAPCAIRGGALETMLIDSGVEPWREVQEHANLNYDCHCNRILLPDSSIRRAPRCDAVF